MSKTTFRQALESHVDQLMENEGNKIFLLTATHDINKDRAGREWIEGVCLNHYGTYDYYDAHCILQVRDWVRQRKIAQLFVPLGHMPSRDADIEGNNTKLQDLPYPFSANFTGGLSSDDGPFSWSSPVEFQLGENMDYIIKIKEGRIPLEVGTTAAERTLFHLLEDGGVARWSYGRDGIHVFLVTERIYSGFVHRGDIKMNVK